LGPTLQFKILLMNVAKSWKNVCSVLHQDMLSNNFFSKNTTENQIAKRKKLCLLFCHQRNAPRDHIKKGIMSPS
jgi:hypothetical protein